MAFRSPKSIRLVTVLFVLGSILTACGSSDGGGLQPDDWATIGAYEQHVTDLSTQVAVLMTTVPTAVPATPQLPFTTAWKTTVADLFTAPSFPNPTPDDGDPPEIKARGSYLVVKVTAENITLEPIARYPWWQLRLFDGRGRLFTPDTEATDAYVATLIDMRKPNEYQPSLSYPEIVVFDVPSDLVGPTLVSADATFSMPLQDVPPIPTPSP